MKYCTSYRALKCVIIAGWELDLRCKIPPASLLNPELLNFFMNQWYRDVFYAGIGYLITLLALLFGWQGLSFWRNIHG